MYSRSGYSILSAAPVSRSNQLQFLVKKPFNGIEIPIAFEVSIDVLLVLDRARPAAAG